MLVEDSLDHYRLFGVVNKKCGRVGRKGSVMPMSLRGVGPHSPAPCYRGVQTDLLLLVCAAIVVRMRAKAAMEAGPPNRVRAS